MIRWNLNKNTAGRGFTIVELLIVVVVIAILAAITIVGFNGIQQKARDSGRLTALRTVVNGLEMHYQKYGYYPDACNSLNTGCEISNLSASLVPEFISAVPKDPGQGITLRYVVGGTPALWGRNYGVWVDYETQPACKYLRGNNPPAGWWPDDPNCTI
jgi:prepilin-type N-terminal cleavage/methylation domain-containing protein